MNALTPGIIVGVLAAAGAASVALHHPALGAFLSDAATAQSATAVISGIGALIAGFLKGWQKDAAK